MAAFLPDASLLHILSDKSFENSPHKRNSRSHYRIGVLGRYIELKGLIGVNSGDILLIDGDAYLFVQESLADFIYRNLTRIRHTSVYVEVEDEQTFSYTPAIEEIKGTVASVRLDSLLSLVFHVSTSKLVCPLIEGQDFVNGKLITTNSYNVKKIMCVCEKGVGDGFQI